MGVLLVQGWNPQVGDARQLDGRLDTCCDLHPLGVSNVFPPPPSLLRFFFYVWGLFSYRPAKAIVAREPKVDHALVVCGRPLCAFPFAGYFHSYAAALRWGAIRPDRRPPKVYGG